MTDNQERALLIEALTRAEGARLESRTTLLGGPSVDYTRIATEAVESCPSFKAVCGQVLYTANSLLVLHSNVLVSQLSFRTSQGVPEAVDWFLKVLRTRTASGTLVAAVWGISLDEPIQLSAQEKLIPFDQLRLSYFKERIEERAKRYGSPRPWIAANFWKAPTAAYVRENVDIPYIGRTRAPIDHIEAALAKAKDNWTLIEIVGAGAPLVFGSWFEYDDESLDLSKHENNMYFSHAEVAPFIDVVVPAQTERMRNDLSAFGVLPGPYRDRLLRSANRFCLSQCRRQFGDRALDLALAYEIALSGVNETNAAVSWKVSVRAAQVIGGSVADRVACRNRVNDFYRIRSKAAHGGELKSAEVKDVVEATGVFRRLFLCLVQLKREPVWSELELEAVSKP